MTIRGKTILKGHSIWREGAATTDNGFDLVESTAPGHTICQCGAVSPYLPNTNQRKIWHRAHKDSLRCKQ